MSDFKITSIIASLHRLKSQKSGFQWLKKFMVFILFALAVATVALIIFLLWIIKDLPNISNINEIVFAESSIIYDRNGEELYTIHGDENRKTVPIEKIPDSLIKSTIAIEDATFFEHSGFSWKGYTRALLSEIVNFGSHKGGGSTLTQQFIKNTFLSSEKTYTRKIKELILSLQLEWKFEKDEILAMYLNSIPYGSNSFGVEQASLTFFGKPVEKINLAESAILAALPQAPSRYSPYDNNKTTKLIIPEEKIKEIDVSSYLELLEEIGEESIELGLLPMEIELNNGSKIIIPGRTSAVLGRMVELGFIEEEVKDKTEKELANFSFKTFRVDIKAPHFVMYVKSLLEETYGKEFVSAGGLKIYTTLDYELQKKAEEILKERSEINEKKYGAKNAALISIIPKTGEIISMVGARDYWDEENDGKVNVILQRRLPGSSFKPFAYAAAFSSGYAPATVVFDLQTDFGNNYKPKNFDGLYRGPISMRRALGNSLNIPAIKAGILGGLEKTYNIAKGMGLSFLKEADWYGSAISLGVAEIRPLDMAQAYATFANLGKRVEITPFLKIVDKNGNILESLEEKEGKQVLDEETAYLVTNVLADPSARGHGWNSVLQLPNHINAVKTGTSNKKIKDIVWPLDGWTIGYTPDLITTVWAGNNDGSAMAKNSSGFSTAGPIWRQFMIEALKEKESKDFQRPTGIKSVLVSSITGKLPTADFPKSLITKEIFSSFNIPKEYDSSLKIITVDKISGKLPNEFTPEDAKKKIAVVRWSSQKPDNPDWQNPVKRWAEAHSKEFLERLNVDEVLSSVPQDIETIHTSQNTSEKPEVKIISPTSFGIVGEKGVGVWTEINSKQGISFVEFFLDDKLVDTNRTPPYKGNIIFSDGTKVGDTFSIKVKAYDTLYNSSSTSIQVKVAEDSQAPNTEIIFPKNGESLFASSIISVQTYSYDKRGDISHVDFFLNDVKVTSSEISPYTGEIKLPSEVGTYKIKIIAYDNTSNTAEDEIEVRVTSKEISKDLKVEVSENIKFGDSERIKFFVPSDDLPDVNEVVLIARYKSETDIETEDQILFEIKNLEDGSSGIFEYLWIRPLTGEYDVFVKTVYENGKVLFSSKNRVEVSK